MEVDEDRLIRIPEVSRITGFAPNTLRAWRHRKVGPRSFRVAGAVMYRETDVREWLAQQLAKSVVDGDQEAS
jgi:predicted DNA-binding transcriptional regulator AlpA